MVVINSRVVTALALAVGVALPIAAQGPAIPSGKDVFGEDGKIYFGAQLGLLGPGVYGGYDFLDVFSVRGQIHWLQLPFERELSDSDYDVDLVFTSLGVLLDWHAYEGFRVTGGVYYSDNHVDAAAEAMDLNIGDRQYAGNLDANLAFNGVAPYIGVGWTSGRGEPGLGYLVDVGLFFQGSPELTTTGEVGVDIAGTMVMCGFDVSGKGEATITGTGCDTALPMLGDDVEQEHETLLGKLGDLDLYPVISVGATYRF